jgi:hypothetical protein
MDYGNGNIFPAYCLIFSESLFLPKDETLIKAVNIYSKYGVGMWKKVAEYVQKNLKEPSRDENGNVVLTVLTNHQCGERYKHHLDPSIKQRNCEPWTSVEVLSVSYFCAVLFL